MEEKKSFFIPVIPKQWPQPERKYPVSRRENLMLAMNHKKPVWMPGLYSSSKEFRSTIARDSPIERTQNTTDWFGVEYIYSEAQGSNTPQGNLLNDITEWEDKIRWPDLNQFDWEADGKLFERDPALATFMRMSNGPFERMHMIEGFEQALVDLITEPEAVEAFLERLVDFKIDLFNRIRDHVELDFIVAADDWGTMRAPFFSTAAFEETILRPTKRFVKAVQSRGTKFVAHCCGVVEQFVPYMVDEIGFDVLEIQGNLNDVSGILAKYGDRVTVEFQSAAQLVHDPDMTEERIREYGRAIVDNYGAHNVSGAGVVVNVGSSFERIYYALEGELYDYSRAKYAGLK